MTFIWLGTFGGPFCRRAHSFARIELYRRAVRLGKRGTRNLLVHAFVAGLILHGSAASSQNVSSTSIRGTVKDQTGELVKDAYVEIINTETGNKVDLRARLGRFVAAGLEVGGPYSLKIRRLGFRPFARDSIFVALGQHFEIEVTLSPVTMLLPSIQVTADRSAVSPGARMGVGLRVSQDALRNLPTLNRDLYDFVQLTPEVSVRQGFISGGGASRRYNNFLIDGVSERHLQGNQPMGGVSGGKSLSIEAIREYEVVLSAFDVRYGDFAGTLINAVTKRGTNDPSGSAFIYGRSDRIARETTFLRNAPYERYQYGFTAGGPIIRDRLHFFIAPEFQRLAAPAPGPYLGQEEAGRVPAPVSAADVERFTLILRQYGLEAGSPGLVSVKTPLANVFGRVDASLPGLRSRAVFSHNYSHVRSDQFNRLATAGLFPLTSSAFVTELVAKSSSVRVITTALNGLVNELSFSYSENPVWAIPSTSAPLIVVPVDNTNPTGGRVSLQSGTPSGGEGVGQLQQQGFEISDHLSFSVGPRHQLSMGVGAESFLLRAPKSELGSFGRWDFSGLDSLRAGLPRQYTVTIGPGGQTLRGLQYAAYAGDDWRAGETLEVSLGLRADAVDLTSRPRYNDSIYAIYRRSTAELPEPRIRLSPRLGFTWSERGRSRWRVRGGAGVFATRPPLAWVHSAFVNSGNVATLVCGPGFAPHFEPNYRLAPSQCSNGAGPSMGAVQFLGRHLNLLTENLRTSLAYDREFPWGIRGTVETLYSRSLNDFMFVNVNLAGPQGVDRFGRVMYGTIAPSGISKPTAIAVRPTDITDFELQNHSRNRAYQIAARLDKSETGRLALSAGYTFSHVNDVQSLLAGFPPAINLRTNRVVSGVRGSVMSGVSSLEARHRVVLSGIALAPWRRTTRLAFYYVGESGMPFHYLASGAQGRGDLNADGSNANDPIYVPQVTADTMEIRFSGQQTTPGADNSPIAQAARVAEQQAAFEKFISGSVCLRHQRGRIMEWNSCRGPWVHTTNVSLGQSIFAGKAHALMLQLEVFNFLNLLSSAWGQYRQPTTVILQQVGQTSGSAAQSQPIFQFNTATRRHSTENIESGYQLQLALRYVF